jgi:hypothetical protein
LEIPLKGFGQDLEKHLKGLSKITKTFGRGFLKPDKGL